MSRTRQPKKFPHVSIFRIGSRYCVQYRVPGDAKRSSHRVALLSTAEHLASRVSMMIDLAKAGLLLPEAVKQWRADQRPLAEHIDAFDQVLSAANVGDEHRRGVVAHLRVLAQVAQWKGLSDLSRDSALLAIRRLRRQGPPQVEKRSKPKPVSAQTALHYARHAKQFGKWLADSKRLPANPFTGLDTGGFDVKNNRVYRRRVPTDAELALLIGRTWAAAPRTTRKVPRILKMSGRDRALCYWTTFETGLRRGEILALTPESFGLELEPPRVFVPGKATKNGRPAYQAIGAELAGALAEWLRDKPPGQAVFPLPEDAAAMLRRDCEAAGVAYEVDGEVFDFHAGRYVCGSRLVASGADLKAVQEIMRHSTITLTMDRYCKVDLTHARGAVAKLPPLPIAWQGEGKTG